MIPVPSFQNLLRFDAISCGIAGVGLLLARHPLEIWTGFPAPVLFWVGIVLLPITASMALASRSAKVSPLVAKLFVYGNCLWVVVTLPLPFLTLLPLTPLGWLLLVLQAVFVAVMAGLEWAARP
ncbi:MAG: hypothetical protein QM645_07425 [Asticcacaulis sp.]